SVEAFHYELRAMMEMTGLRSRAPSQTRVVQKSENDALETLAESPFAMALVEPSGAVRFVNRAFAQLTGGGDGPVSSILDLPGIVGEAQLTDALWICAETRKPMTKRIASWGDGHWVMLVAPVLRGVE